MHKEGPVKPVKTVKPMPTSGNGVSKKALAPIVKAVKEIEVVVKDVIS